MAFMRNNNNGRRHNNHNNHNRHRHPNQGGQGQQGARRNVNRINQVFESNGPEGRIRGTAQQIVEKYSMMARDVASSDKVLSMNYLQHAEHYQRLVNEIMEEQGIYEREREQLRQQQAQQPDVSGEATAEFAPAGEQPSFQPQQQRGQQRQPAAQQDDDNALPSFLHVPITSSETAPAQSQDNPAPRRSQQRQRRANSSGDEAAE